MPDEQQQPSFYALPAQVAIDIANYLGGKPWIEVDHLVRALQALEPAEIHPGENES